MREKGLIALNGVAIGEIERAESWEKGRYKFTYDPSFYECYQLGNLEIRDEPHLLMLLPEIMIKSLGRVDRDEIERIRLALGEIDDLALWLACSDRGLIPEYLGGRIIYH